MHRLKPCVVACDNPKSGKYISQEDWPSAHRLYKLPHVVLGFADVLAPCNLWHSPGQQVMLCYAIQRFIKSPGPQAMSARLSGTCTGGLVACRYLLVDVALQQGVLDVRVDDAVCWRPSSVSMMWRGLREQQTDHVCLPTQCVHRYVLCNHQPTVAAVSLLATGYC